jgi:PTH1 family peptidyl-tRNA hydrolase
MDEVELPFGQVRLKLKGSAAGHNGLRSIEASLRTQEYPRYGPIIAIPPPHPPHTHTREHCGIGIGAAASPSY